jgi:hypothetical protein
MKRSSIEGLKHNTRLDVRLPDQLKDEFLARCREEGVSSGAVIRSMILDYVTAQPRRWPAMAAGLKETVVKRSKWIAGGIGGGAAAGLAAMSLLFAPTASAEDVRVDYDLKLEGVQEDLSISHGHDTALGQGWLIIPAYQDGSFTYAVEMNVRNCREDELRLDLACEVAFDIEIIEVLDYYENQFGGVTITEQRRVANPIVFGRFGQAITVSNIVEDAGATLTLNTRATAS